MLRRRISFGGELQLTITTDRAVKRILVGYLCLISCQLLCCTPTMSRDRIIRLNFVQRDSEPFLSTKGASQARGQANACAWNQN
jgi:hypothetical protein